MRYGPTREGGRSVAGDTPYGKFQVIWDSNNNLIKAENTPKDPSIPKQEQEQEQEKETSGIGRRTAKEIASGIIGITKNELGIGQTDKETMTKRYNICLDCPSKKHELGTCKAKGCGCYIAAKVRLKSESCPIGHW